MSHIENRLRKLETQLQPAEDERAELDELCRHGARGALFLYIASELAAKERSIQDAARERLDPDEYEEVMAKAKRLAAEYLQK